MKQELEKLCTDFIANRDTVRDAFRWENSAVYATCANLFCAGGQIADKDRLAECRKIISKQTGLFSKFKGQLAPILSCILALDDHPQERMALAIDDYRLLKQSLKDSEYLALIAFLLPETEDKSVLAEKIARGKALFRRMDKEHPFLTNDSDSVFAVTLAFSGKTDDALMEDMESFYQTLKTRFSNGAAQTAAQILAAVDGRPEEKAQRLIGLYDALREAKIDYGQSGELAPLAALSLTVLPLPTLVNEIQEADAFLKAQKSYDSVEKEQRAMHAAMIVSNQYAGAEQVNPSAMTHALDLLIAKRQALYLSLFFNSLELVANILGSSSEEQTENGADETTEAQPGEGGAEEAPAASGGNAHR